jgi:hypothetical protein
MGLNTKEITHTVKKKEKELYLISQDLLLILGNSTTIFLMVKDMCLMQKGISLKGVGLTE